jgi:hypothetical protein
MNCEIENCKTNQWSIEKAWNWYGKQPWPCGFNYIPANAISYTEMWMDYCFDPDEIDKELKLAQDVGFNCTRVVLPFVVWEHEPEAFKQRIEKFLDICHQRGIRVMLALFDDCAFGPMVNPVYGRQPDVINGWYGNGWTPSPGHDLVRDPLALPRLEKYVKDIIESFKDDNRLWVWDLYNEPTNGVAIGQLNMPLGDITIPLVEKVFGWAREVNPSQPLTLGKWNDNSRLNNIAYHLSDIITFHNYGTLEVLQKDIAELKQHGRPVICTEWMNRGTGSTVADCLPIFKCEGVGAIHWGLVNGKTQTHLNWGHLPGEPEPKLWQHDLFLKNHTPYDVTELTAFRDLISM